MPSISHRLRSPSVRAFVVLILSCSGALAATWILQVTLTAVPAEARADGDRREPIPASDIEPLVRFVASIG